MATLALSGCSSDDRYSRVLPILKGLNPFAEQTAIQVTREQISAIPFATMRVSVNDSAFVYLPAVDQVAGDVIYRSTDNRDVYMRGGRIVRTRGLETDLAGTAAGGDPVAANRLLAVQTTADSSRTVTYTVFDRYNTTRTRNRDVALTCTVERQDAERITILELEFDTIRFDESCNEPEGRWPHVNQYWVDAATGQPWRIVQHFHPKASTAILVEITKPLG